MFDLRTVKLPTVDNPLEKLSYVRLLVAGMVSLAVQTLVGVIICVTMGFALMGGEPSIEALDAAMKDPLISRISSVVGPIFGIAAGFWVVRAQLRALFATLKNYAAVLIGVGLGAAIYGFCVLYDLILKAPDNANETLLNAEFSASPLIFVISTAILAPILEELAFRVGVFGFLRRFGRPVAYVASAIIFTLVHLDLSAANLTAELVSIPTYVIPSFVLAFAYDKFGFWSSCAMHITNNSLACLMLVI